MVYAYLVKSHEYNVPPPHYKPPFDREHFGKSQDYQSSYFAMNPAFVGMSMAIEIAEVYYAQNRFYCTTETDLKEMLLGDPFDLGIKPFEHIRRLCVRVDVPRRAYTTCTEYEILAGKYDCIKLLDMITHKRQLSIKIILITDLTNQGGDKLDNERQMYNILEMIRQPVYDLMFTGSHVEVRQVDDEPNAVGHRPLSDGESNRLFFGLTEEEWLKVICNL
jgi:hypothetical protein